jgi:hypothetical protein
MSKVAEAYVIFRADTKEFKKEIKTIPAAVKDAIGKIGADSIVKPAVKNIGRALRDELLKSVDGFAEKFKKTLGTGGGLIERLKKQVEKAVNVVTPTTTNLAKNFAGMLMNGVKKADEILRKAASNLEAKLRAAAQALGVKFEKAQQAPKTPTQSTSTAPKAPKKTEEQKAAEKADKDAAKQRASNDRQAEQAQDKRRKDAQKEREREAKARTDERQARKDSVKSQAAGALGLTGVGELGGTMLGKAGPFAAILAGALLALNAVQQLKKAITAAVEASKADFELKYAAKGPGRSGWSPEQMKKMNEAFRGDTAFGNKEVTQAQTQLARMPNIKGDQFKGALKAAGDLSAAMGMELPAAAKAVGDALNDPMKVAEQGLEEYGIMLTQAQKNQIKNAEAARDFAGAQQLVLDAFKQYGGAAQEFAKGPEGAFKKFETSVENLREKIGSKILPILTKIIDHITMMIDFTSAAFDDMGGAANVFWSNFKWRMSSALDGIIDFFSQMRAVASGTWSSMVAGAEEAWDQIVDAFDPSTNGTGRTIGGQMSKAFNEAYQKVVDKSNIGASDRTQRLKKEAMDITMEFMRKHNLLPSQKGIDKFNEKPDAANNNYVSRKPFQFEFTGMTDMYKKIQEQLIPSEQVQMERMQLKAAEMAVNEQQKANGFLARIDQAMQNKGVVFN